MKKVALIAAILIVVIYLLALTVPVNPDEQRPGTRLSGELVEARMVDWSFIDERKQVYVQTSTWYGVPHSVTTTSWVLEGDLYVPCGWCASKRWPKNVESDPKVMLKVDDKLYERQAVLITDPAERHRILSTLVGHDVDDALQVYRMDPRA